jgi:hypothetical protein
VSAIIEITPLPVVLELQEQQSWSSDPVQTAFSKEVALFIFGEENRRKKQCSGCLLLLALLR